jgi:transcriptional regulator with XRE-family HTH domain
MMNSGFKKPGELGLIIASNVRAQRKARKLSLRRLSEMSGVSYGSMKRFESTGEIALASLLKIAIVMDCTDAFEQLFARTEPQSIQEIIDGKL